MTKRVKQAIDNILSTEDGAIFVGMILTEAGVFSPQKTAEELAVQQFGIKLAGLIDLYTTRGDFPVRYVKSLYSLPRSQSLTKPLSED